MYKDDYIVWRDHSVTDEFKQAVIRELDFLVADLVKSAGDDPQVDKYRRGVIHGLTFLIDWEPEFTTIEGDTEDGIDSEGSSDSY